MEVVNPEPEGPHYVSPADHHSLVAALALLPGDSRNGFFGPGSITWQVNRESAVFLGAGRAALLQLAHPWVAAALAQHSNLMNDAIDRFHSTFRVIYTMLFGSRAQASEASKQLYQRHTAIRGELPAGPHYEANEVAALRWVYATLVESAVKAYEFVLPPLLPVERDQYYAESKRMAALFGIPAHALPNTWSEFLEYVAAMVDSPQLSVDATALALSRSVLSGAGTWIRPPRWYHALTASWMPPRLRAAFALNFNAPEQQAVRSASQRLPHIYPGIPGRLRFVGPFHEAKARLSGRAPGILTQQSNRFWMGQPRLLYANLPQMESAG
jgi:uncharacterized protein (DUF2236 family)